MFIVMKKSISNLTFFKLQKQQNCITNIALIYVFFILNNTIINVVFTFTAYLSSKNPIKYGFSKSKLQFLNT